MSGIQINGLHSSKSSNSKRRRNRESIPDYERIIWIMKETLQFDKKVSLSCTVGWGENIP